MSARIKKSAIIMLAVQFHKRSERRRNTSPEHRRSLTHAVLRPSRVFTRRRIRVSLTGIPASSKTA